MGVLEVVSDSCKTEADKGCSLLHDNTQKEVQYIQHYYVIYSGIIAHRFSNRTGARFSLCGPPVAMVMAQVA